MSERELDLDEIREKLLNGERLSFNLRQTGVLQAKVAKRRIEEEGGTLKSIRLGQKDTDTIKFVVEVSAANYPVSFRATYDIGNDGEAGNIKANNLKVKGSIFGRGYAGRIAREILGHPNRNLELETDLPEDSLCVRIVDQGTEVWLRQDNIS